MTSKPKIITNNNFPLDKEIVEITKRVSTPNYPYVNYALPDNASSAERVKYSLCQNVACYARKNNLSEQELAQKIGVNKEKLTDILFSKIYNLNLEELITYTDNLHIPFEIKITNNQNQSNIKNNIK